jgi:hypothetical protein
MVLQRVHLPHIVDFVHLPYVAVVMNWSLLAGDSASLSVLQDRCEVSVNIQCAPNHFYSLLELGCI